MSEKLVHNNSTLECIAAQIISRKILPSAFVEIPNIGICFTYKCSLNSEAKILKELIPKICKVNEFSLLDLDSKLECDKLFVAIKKNKPYRLRKINFTGRHKAQTFITDEFTFAQITLQIGNIPFLNPEKVIKYVQAQDINKEN